MDDQVNSSAAVTGPWETFECRVTALLSTMTAGGSFRLFVPKEDGSSDELSVDCADGLTGATVASATYGATSFEFDFEADDGVVGRCQAITDAIIDLVREVSQLPDPGLLTVSAPADLRARIGVLGLADRADVGEDHVRTGGRTARDAATAVWPTSHDELAHLVLEHLRDECDAEIEPDEDGDFPLCVGRVQLWVKIADGMPAIILGAPVVAEVKSVQRADTELNVLNRNNTWVRWSRRDRVVWQELAMVARPFVPGQFDAMVAMFVDACTAARFDLSDRLGAKVAR